MNIWRLIAHHDRAKQEEALQQMKSKNRICIGWSDADDLSKQNIESASNISKLIKLKHSNNYHCGGPSLWNLYREMKIGDLVIVVIGHSKRVCVFEVIGDYIFSSKQEEICGYPHQRNVRLTNINPDKLWDDIGAHVEKGQNIRWTLALCKKTIT